MTNYFSDKELCCKCGNCDCSITHMDANFMKRLNELRELYGKPIYLSSAYRCAEHNAYVRGVPNSPHTRGIAVDIIVSGQDAYRIVKLALKLGFTGIGVKQFGKTKNRFIHLDLEPMSATRPALWSY